MDHKWGLGKSGALASWKLGLQGIQCPLGPGKAIICVPGQSCCGGYRTSQMVTSCEGGWQDSASYQMRPRVLMEARWLARAPYPQLLGGLGSAQQGPQCMLNLAPARDQVHVRWRGWGESSEDRLGTCPAPASPNAGRPFSDDHAAFLMEHNR